MNISCLFRSIPDSSTAPLKRETLPPHCHCWQAWRHPKPHGICESTGRHAAGGVLDSIRSSIWFQTHALSSFVPAFFVAPRRLVCTMHIWLLALPSFLLLVVTPSNETLLLVCEISSFSAHQQDSQQLLL